MNIFAVVMIVAVFSAIGAFVGSFVGTRGNDRKMPEVHRGLIDIQTQINNLNERIDREWGSNGNKESISGDTA